MPAITIYCSTCGRRKLINPSCGKRNCKRCQFKRARKLERKYLPAIIEKQNKPGHMWTFVNLTCIHFTVETDSLCSILRRFGNAMQKFLSEEYEEEGLAVIENQNFQSSRSGRRTRGGCSRLRHGRTCNPHCVQTAVVHSRPRTLL